MRFPGKVGSTTAARLSFLLLAGAGCSATSPDVNVGGTYALARVDNLALPADIGPMPQKGGIPSNCRMIVRDGSLTLDSGSTTFSYVYRQTDSCNTGVVGESGGQGSYSVSGSVITFHANAGPGRVITYFGTTDGARVTLSHEFHQLDFRR